MQASDVRAAMPPVQPQAPIRNIDKITNGHAFTHLNQILDNRQLQDRKRYETDVQIFRTTEQLRGKKWYDAQCDARHSSLSPSLWLINYCSDTSTSIRVHNEARCALNTICCIVPCMACCAAAFTLTCIGLSYPANIVVPIPFCITSFCSPMLCDTALTISQECAVLFLRILHEKDLKVTQEQLTAIQRLKFLSSESLDIATFCKLAVLINCTAVDLQPIVKNLNLSELFQVKIALTTAYFTLLIAPSLSQQELECLEIITSLCATRSHEIEPVSSCTTQQPRINNYGTLPLEEFSLPTDSFNSKDHQKEQLTVQEKIIHIQSFIKHDPSLWRLLLQKLPDANYKRAEQLLLQLSPLTEKTVDEQRKIRVDLQKQEGKVNITLISEETGEHLTLTTYKNHLFQVPYFRGRFTSGMRDDSQTEIRFTFPKNQYKAFPDFLAFIEKKNIQINKSNDLPLFQLANYFQVLDLHQICYNSLIKRFSNCHDLHIELQRLQTLIDHGGAGYIKAANYALLNQCTLRTDNEITELFSFILKNNAELHILDTCPSFIQQLINRAEGYPYTCLELLVPYDSQNKYSKLQELFLTRFTATPPTAHYLNPLLQLGKQFSYFGKSLEQVLAKDNQTYFSNNGWQGYFVYADQNIQQQTWPLLKQELQRSSSLFKEVWELAEEKRLEQLKNYCREFFEEYPDCSNITCLWDAKSLPEELRELSIKRLSTAFDSLTLRTNS